MDVTLEIGQGFFAAFCGGLLFEQEDRQGAEEREVARTVGLVDAAAVLVLSAVATMMLAILNAPMITGDLEQLFGGGFLGVVAGDGENRFVSFFDDLALAQVLGRASHAHDLSHPGQADGLRLGGAAPELALFNAPVALIQRLGLRGGNCRAAIARLWPVPLAGWLLRTERSRLRSAGSVGGSWP